jgi:hypothetical protein
MRFARFAEFALLAVLCFLAGCSSTSKVSPPQSAVRNYNGTASVGDFLTIAIDSNAHTITYTNHTNGETGTVPYTVNADGSYTITDPQGNLLAAYEVPGSVMVIEAANAGPNKDTAALITAIENAPISIQTFAGHQFNYTQFRTDNGGVEIGTGNADSSGNMMGSSYDPGAIMWTPPNYFGTGTASASSVVEDPSGDFFTITDQNKGETMTVFGTQNGLFAIDASGGAVIGLPQASAKDFDPTVAGTYNAIYYEKQNAQMQGQCPTACYETGTPVEGKASITVTSAGAVTITDSHSNVMATGTLVAIADDTNLYDGTANKLSTPCYGLFTFETITSSLHQETFVAFEGNAIIFSNFQTALPLVNNGTYTYFYGVGLK